MSQSASLYRISRDDFERLKEVGRKDFNLLTYAKEYETFQGTFMGIEYVLSKNKAENQTKLAEEIFNPAKVIGGTDLSKYDLGSMREMEILALIEDGASVFYHTPETVNRIDALISQISDAEFIGMYDPDELNSNHIYPSSWNRSKEPYAACNERHIATDFITLKKFFSNASREHDYVLCFVG